MEGQERREQIIALMSQREEPISGTELAKQLGVSRQVIVQDIALLRAVYKDIVSTNKGYLLYHSISEKKTRCFLVQHKTEEIQDELCTIVDHGGIVKNVMVTHEIYGKIVADLVIKNRQDVYDFVEKVNIKRTVPLKELSGDVHFHTVEAESEEILDRIAHALKDKNYLIS